MSASSPSVPASSDNFQKSPFWRILKAFILGIIISVVVIVVQAVPKALHTEWLKLGSAYDVENEYLYTNILRRMREGLYYVGVSPDGAIDSALRSWQKEQTDKAFTKIPETDGERVIWQIWLDTGLLRHIDDKNLVPTLLPTFLKDFKALTSMPMASKWARDFKRFEMAGTFAVYFFKNYQNSGMELTDREAELRYILEKMNVLASSLDPKNFLIRSNKSERVWQLKWENSILMFSNIAIHGDYGPSLHCNVGIYKILKETEARLRKLAGFYKSYIRDEYGLKVIDLTEENLRFLPDAESAIQQHCPNINN